MNMALVFDAGLGLGLLVLSCLALVLSCLVYFQISGMIEDFKNNKKERK